MSDRLERRFEELATAGRSGLVTFVTAGDPDIETSARLLSDLPGAGADVIELGMPFSDPMADGPAIQAASVRALASGMTLAKTIDLVRSFRCTDDTTPLVLMGYFNPILAYGTARFLVDAAGAGVDGLIVVDLPAEEDAELCLPARAQGIHFIRLATPTTDRARLPVVLANSSGFLYYVSITGITGAAAPVADTVGAAVARIRAHTKLPIAVGFGIREPQQAASIARIADAVVVGSALVDLVAQHRADGATAVVSAVTEATAALAAAVRMARV